MLRILVIDDHLLFAEGIRSQLERLPGGVHVELTNEGTDALAMVRTDPAYDVIILDLYMPDISGLDLLVSLRAHAVSAPVLMVTAETNAEVAKRALEAGANGYLSKAAASELMLEAVQIVCDGGVFLDPAIPRLAESEHPVPRNNSNVIPPRTLEVLKLIARGHSNKRIASLMDISESTVKWHVSRLFESMDVSNRTACVAKAARIGLVETSD